MPRLAVPGEGAPGEALAHWRRRINSRQDGRRIQQGHLETQDKGQREERSASIWWLAMMLSCLPVFPVLQSSLCDGQLL